MLSFMSVPPMSFAPASRQACTPATPIFTQETWTRIHEEKDARYPDHKIVGWYHSHPGFGVFLSDHDLFIHKNFFSQPGQLAWVFDLNKCSGCQTCSIACKVHWTSEDGTGPMWWCTVNTQPGRGTPRDYEQMGGGYDADGNLLYTTEY